MGTLLIIIGVIAYIIGAFYTIHVIDVDDEINHYKTDEAMAGFLAFGWPITLPLLLSDKELCNKLFKN